jgi:hypothetical protein
MKLFHSDTKSDENAVPTCDIHKIITNAIADEPIA